MRNFLVYKINLKKSKFFSDLFFYSFICFSKNLLAKSVITGSLYSSNLFAFTAPTTDIAKYAVGNNQENLFTIGINDITVFNIIYAIASTID